MPPLVTFDGDRARPAVDPRLQRPDPALRQFEQRAGAIGGRRRGDAGAKVEAYVESPVRPALEQGFRRRFDRILAAQVLTIGRQEQLPPHDHAETLHIPIMAGIEPMAFLAAP